MSAAPMQGQSAAIADILMGELQPVPVSPLAERMRAELQAGLCKMSDAGAALYALLDLAPHNDEALAQLHDEFSGAALQMLHQFEKFKAARDCAGEA
jgi:hypothetical protein